MSFAENSLSYIETKNGESFIAYNGEYVARYNIRSGKSKNILKISPKKYQEKRHFMAISSDLNEIVYINYSKKKLVRLSDWNAKKNRYTKRQEIDIFGTNREEIHRYSADLNLVGIAYADDKNGNYIADFNSGRLIPAELGNKVRMDLSIDRFNNIIRPYGRNIETVDLDGNITTVFKGVGLYCEPYKVNGFFIFYSGGPETYNTYDEGDYELTYYYIDKNGEAAEWYKTIAYFGEVEDDLFY